MNKFKDSCKNSIFEKSAFNNISKLSLITDGDQYDGDDVDGNFDYDDDVFFYDDDDIFLLNAGLHLLSGEQKGKMSLVT